MTKRIKVEEEGGESETKRKVLTVNVSGEKRDREEDLLKHLRMVGRP